MSGFEHHIFHQKSCVKGIVDKIQADSIIMANIKRYFKIPRTWIWVYGSE